MPIRNPVSNPVQGRAAGYLPPMTPEFNTRFHGQRALVIGCTGAIGSALIDRFRPVMAIDALSRRENGLDLTEEASLATWAARLPEKYALIVNATGALEIDGDAPEKSLRQIDPAAMARQFALNAIGPALLLKHFTPLLAKGGIFASLSARVGSIGDNHLGGWVSYRAAKSAQNQIIRCAAIEQARKDPDACIVALHPGTVTSELTRKYLGRHPSVSPQEAAENLSRVIAGLGPDQSGQFLDWRGTTIPW